MTLTGVLHRFEDIFYDAFLVLLQRDQSGMGLCDPSQLREWRSRPASENIARNRGTQDYGGT